MTCMTSPAVSRLQASRTVGGFLSALLLAGCATATAVAQPDPAANLARFEAQRLDVQSLGLPPMTEGWDRAQWFRAAQASSPVLAEMRARLRLAQAGEITAAQRPNPTLNLSTEYIAAAAGMPAWLYGVAVDFLLQASGSRDRVKATALLQTEAASADLADALWQLRVNVQAALLDAVHAEAEQQLLAQLSEQRSALLSASRRRLAAGEAAASEVLHAELDLSAANQRQQQAQQRLVDARQRLALAVGVPVAALRDAPLQWPDWDHPEHLTLPTNRPSREAALLARPELLRALRETDLAELALQAEVGKRWPDLRLSPGYTWDHGVRKMQLGLGLPLPIFNRNEGPIAEAEARRDLAARHTESVQASLFAEIDTAERQWPVLREQWDTALGNQLRFAQLARAERRMLAEGASDRPTLLAAEAAATEAALLQLAAAHEAQKAFSALEDAYRAPLAGPDLAALSTHPEVTP